MTDLRTKIARAIHDNPGAQAQYVKAGIAPHGFENCRYSEQYFNDADAVLAVLDLDKVRAEAWDEGHEAAAMRVPEGVWADVAEPHPGNPYRKAEQ